MGLRRVEGSCIRLVGSALDRFGSRASLGYELFCLGESWQE